MRISSPRKSFSIFMFRAIKMVRLSWSVTGRSATLEDPLCVCGGNKTYVAFVTDGHSGCALYVSAIKLLEESPDARRYCTLLRSTIAVRIAS
ncbi:unnamed protein product [Lasius platythorax]|uniref:Uncharacterized protein n=1 Tax=Lasius platythorax TaxID=488582 RepID=A0AAV2NV63_9HYME